MKKASRKRKKVLSEGVERVEGVWSDRGICVIRASANERKSRWATVSVSELTRASAVERIQLVLAEEEKRKRETRKEVEELAIQLFFSPALQSPPPSLSLFLDVLS